MAINIKNREAERLLGDLARTTGRGKSQLVLELLRKETRRQARLAGLTQRKKRLLALSRRTARRIGEGAPSPEQVLGYGADGLPR